MNVLGATCLNRNIDLAASRRDVEKHTLVHDLDHVAAVAADRGEHLRKHGRLIGDANAHTHKPAVTHEAAVQYGGEKPHVDVAAGCYEPNTASDEQLGVGQHCSERGGPCAFGDHAKVFGQSLNNGLENGLVHDQHVID